MNLGCDYNQNKPVGATKELIKSGRILELFPKYEDQNIQCSIDEGDLAVPIGCRDYFKRHGYMVIKNLYNPKELISPVPQQRGQINYCGSEEKYIHIPEETQVPGSVSRYNHPKYKLIHTKIRLILEDILGEKLYNTYYYDRFYFPGQRLVRHRDRDACEISVSIQISTNSNTPWPFCIEDVSGEEHFANLENGWGLLYKGCEREHWRDPLQSRHTKLKRLWNKIIRKKDDTYHHQIFFHYVRANGPRVHCANDSGQ